MDPVEAALAAVPEKYYVLEPGGRPFPQTSNPQLIAAMLRLGDVVAGARVLEVGTGSGFSTALLSYLVGPSGRIVSLEIDSSVADRTKRLLSAQKVRNTFVLAADGKRGCSGHGPFDLVISWATADVIPQEWVNQVRCGGLIVSPVSLWPLAHAVAVVRLRRDGEQSICGERVIPGTFIPLSETPEQEFGKAPSDADLVIDPDSDPATWVSAPWLREQDTETSRTTLLEHCIARPNTSGIHALTSEESVEAFRVYLLATLPRELTAAYLAPIGRAIGCSMEQGIALLSLKDGMLIVAGTETAKSILMNWVTAWRSLRCPGYDQLKPVATQVPEGWMVRAELRAS